MSTPIRRLSLAVSAVLVSTAGLLAAQAAQAPTVAVVKVVAEPAALRMEAGKTAPLTVTALDAAGREVANAIIRVNLPRRSASWADGQVTAFLVGEHTATIVATGAPGTPPVTIEVPVTVVWPPLKALEISADPGTLYTGVTIGHHAKGINEDGSERASALVAWASSNPRVATVDRFGFVTAVAPGTASIRATLDGTSAERTVTVLVNPVASLELGITEATIRTGDVIDLVGTARRADGGVVNDMPVTWSYAYLAPEGNTPKAPGGAGIIDNGLFVANYPGIYTILAQAGPAHARHTIEVTARTVRQRFVVTGRGIIRDTHTSDLWPYTGSDGRDYCIVGTWGGDGYAHVFDITDPTNIVRTHSVQVDARTINDVTVSPDARYAVMSREGASNRRNGVVFLDLKDPAKPVVASSFDVELTGGVHNMFATNDHLFAVSGGAKYVVINAEDIYKPSYTSEYRHPNARLHDLWVRDGVAYSAQGGAGTVIVDVGNGGWGGSLTEPKLINTVPIDSGHEIYPYFQKSTGKTYLFIGDEQMNRRGRVWEGSGYSLSGPDGAPPKGGIAQTSGGYTHIVDFTEPMNPRKVGRYQLEDYGSHDIIVEDDILYQAYYDGGVRIVDVSGRLMGNLYDQGREIAVFKPYDPEGYTANAPFVMNAMPWKGHILFTDFNSGLWMAKLEKP